MAGNDKPVSEHEMERRPPDFDRLLQRLDVHDKSYGQLTTRIDAQAEKHAALERVVDKIAAVIEAQRDLRAERDERFKERIDGIETDLSEFIRETRDGFKDMRAFGKQIAILAISSVFGGVGAIVVFFLTRGTGNG